MSHETRDHKALGKTEVRTVKKQTAYKVSITRDDGKPITDTEYITCLQTAIKQRIKREAEKAADSVRKQIEYLRTERPELYQKFTKGARLDDLLDVIAGERRLIKGLRSGALR